MSKKNGDVIGAMSGSQYEYEKQLNARTAVPEHSKIILRWQKLSFQARYSSGGIFDLAYGGHPMEKLDFFQTEKYGGPLLVFIHGGFFRSLDKSDFTFIVEPYRRVGINVALTNYALAPQASVEEIAMQQLRALAWLYRQAKNLNYDRDRIVIAGHSAGAHLASMMMAAYWPIFGSELPVDLIKAGVLISGLYDLEPVSLAEFINKDLKLDKVSALRLSPVYMEPPLQIPFITSVGDQESNEFKRQTALISSNWKQGFRKVVPQKFKNHFTICDSFADESDKLFKETCELIHSI